MFIVKEASFFVILMDAFFVRKTKTFSAYCVYIFLFFLLVYKRAPIGKKSKSSCSCSAKVIFMQHLKKNAYPHLTCNLKSRSSHFIFIRTRAHYFLLTPDHSLLFTPFLARRSYAFIQQQRKPLNRGL